MVSKTLRMNASASPEMRATPREFKRRVKSLTNLEDPTPKKYIHVHHFKNTKLFGAWFNDPSKAGKKVRLFFGNSYRVPGVDSRESPHSLFGRKCKIISETNPEILARGIPIDIDTPFNNQAQDRAALKYKPHALDPRSIQLNFKEEDYIADQKLREMLTCEEFGELLRRESRPKYTKMEPTPCLRKFMAHERARGNIPSAVPLNEDRISLRQYLTEVIRKREQPDEDMADAVPTDEESSEYQGSSDEEMEDPVPTAEQKKHALKVERKERSEGKRIVVFTGPRNPRSSVAGPSECKPLVIAPVPLVWGQLRPRTKRHEDHEYNKLKLENKLHKIDSTKKSRMLAPPTKPEDLPTEVEKTTSPEGAPVEPEGDPIEPEGLPTEVENTSSPEPGNDGLPQSPELQLRIKWHYKMHKIQKLQTSRARGSAEILPAEVEETKTPEPGSEGLPQSPEFSNVQFRSKWHYMLHKIQQLQTSRTIEPSPKNAEGSYLQTLAITVLSQDGKLV